MYLVLVVFTLTWLPVLLCHCSVEWKQTYVRDICAETYRVMSRTVIEIYETCIIHPNKEDDAAFSTCVREQLVLPVMQGHELALKLLQHFSDPLLLC